MYIVQGSRSSASILKRTQRQGDVAHIAAERLEELAEGQLRCGSPIQ